MEVRACLSCDLLDSGQAEAAEDAIALKEGQDSGEQGPRLWTREAKGISGVPPVSPSLSLSPFSVSLITLVSGLHCQILTGPRILSVSLGPCFFLLFLHSGHLHEMSVKDKDTGKNPGRVGRKRGQGHKDS